MVLISFVKKKIFIFIELLVFVQVSSFDDFSFVPCLLVSEIEEFYLFRFECVIGKVSRAFMKWRNEKRNLGDNFVICQLVQSKFMFIYILLANRY